MKVTGQTKNFFGKGIYGTPVWSPRGDLIAFTKVRKGKFYIGVMRADGTGERLNRKFLSRSSFMVTNGRVLVFYRETKSGSKGEGFTAKLWSIDITVIMRGKWRQKPMLLTHLGLHCYQSEVFSM